MAPKEKGDLRIDTLSRDFKAGMDSYLWAEVNERTTPGKCHPRNNPVQMKKKFQNSLPNWTKISEGKAPGWPPVHLWLTIA